MAIERNQESADVASHGSRLGNQAATWLEHDAKMTPKETSLLSAPEEVHFTSRNIVHCNARQSVASPHRITTAARAHRDSLLSFQTSGL